MDTALFACSLLGPSAVAGLRPGEWLGSGRAVCLEDRAWYQQGTVGSGGGGQAGAQRPSQLGAQLCLGWINEPKLQWAYFWNDRKKQLLQTLEMVTFLRCGLIAGSI